MSLATEADVAAAEGDLAAAMAIVKAVGRG